jgi:MOSC domain-containing protein YiiM
MEPRVSAVCVVHTLLPEPSTPTGLTSIDKRPVAGPVQVGPLGLAGDSQQDTPHHGGTEFAVYCYAEEDAAAWAAELGREVPPGLFGENLRTTGLDVSGLAIGTRLAVGDAGLVLEVTAPRNPCATFARRMGEPRWVRRFTERRAPGAYARVVVPGPVSAGDAITVLTVPEQGVSVAALMAPALPGAAAALLAAEAAGAVSLGERMRRGAQHEARRG